METRFRNEKSLNGYSLDVLKSGLQKYIRRGITDKALYCAGELDLFAECGHAGERIRTNFIHRLMIIFMEDVSLGNYHIWNTLSEKVFYLLNNRSSSNSSSNSSSSSSSNSNSSNRSCEIQTIKDIITLLSLSKKTRILSHINNFTECEKECRGTPLEKYFSSLDSLNSLDSLEHLIKIKSIRAFIIAKKSPHDLIFHELSKYVDVSVANYGTKK